MHDHIHRQIAHNRIADLKRAQSRRIARPRIPERPPNWIRRRIAR